MIDEQITQAARAICAAQADRQDNEDSQRYLSGDWDHTIWMRLVEKGIHQGIVYKQIQLSNGWDRNVWIRLVEEGMRTGIFMALQHDLADESAKPDPLADAVESVLSGFEGRKHAESYANQIRAALEARGLEIRSKNDD